MEEEKKSADPVAAVKPVYSYHSEKLTDIYTNLGIVRPWQAITRLQVRFFLAGAKYKRLPRIIR